jgi:hypothetical protein
MNFLEIIGLFAVLCVGLALINELIKGVDKTKAEHDRISKEVNPVLGSGGSTNALPATSSADNENSKLEVSSIDVSRRGRFYDAAWYDSQTEYEAVLNVYKNKIPFMSGEEKRDLFRRLAELSPEVWGDIASDVRGHHAGDLSKARNE